MQKQDYAPYWAHFYPVSTPEFLCIVKSRLVNGTGY